VKELIANRCMECGHYTITKYDGRRCAKCGGVVLRPMGNATYDDFNKKNKCLTVNVKLIDTKIVKRMIDVFYALMDDNYTPDWIKTKIQRYVLDELNKK